MWNHLFYDAVMSEKLLSSSKDQNKRKYHKAVWKQLTSIYYLKKNYKEKKYSVMTDICLALLRSHSWG